jgi:hypothetical protein
MSGIDYGTIATITIFTSFFVGVGQELAKIVISYVKKWHNRIKTIKV